MEIMIGIIIGIIMGVFMGMYFKIILRKIFKIIPIFEQYKFSNLCGDCSYNLNIKFDSVKEEITIYILSKYKNGKIIEYFNSKFNYDYYDKLDDKFIYEYLYYKHLPIRKDFFEYLIKKISYKILKNKKEKENINFNRLSDIDINIIMNNIIDTNVHFLNGGVKIGTNGLWSSNESKLDELLKNNIII